MINLFLICMKKNAVKLSVLYHRSRPKSSTTYSTVVCISIHLLISPSSLGSLWLCSVATVCLSVCLFFHTPSLIKSIVCLFTRPTVYLSLVCASILSVYLFLFISLPGDLSVCPCNWYEVWFSSMKGTQSVHCYAAHTLIYRPQNPPLQVICSRSRSHDLHDIWNTKQFHGAAWMGHTSLSWGLQIVTCILSKKSFQHSCFCLCVHLTAGQAGG